MSIPKNTVSVSTAAYELAHGRKPRGYGSWAFAFGDRNAEPTWVKDVRGSGGMTYVEARRIAVAQAAAQGIDEIFACT